MQQYTRFFVALILFALAFSSCRRETMRLRSSVRKTQNDVRYFNRDVNKVKNLAGIDTKEKSTDDTLNTAIYTPIDQKNIFHCFDEVSSRSSVCFLLVSRWQLGKSRKLSLQFSAFLCVKKIPIKDRGLIGIFSGD